MRKLLFLASVCTILFASCSKEVEQAAPPPTPTPTPTPTPEPKATLSNIIYLLSTDGRLAWYKHLGYEDGTDKWDNAGQPTYVNDTLQALTFAFRADSNTIYGIKANGHLGMYRHTGWKTGTRQWESNGQFRRVGEDWNLMRYAFSGGGNIVYAIKPNGDLGWYKHTGQPDGTPAWENNGQFKLIATGWGDYVRAFSPGNGIIYVIKTNGEMGWFKHLGYQDGSSNWENGGIYKRVGEDWNLLTQGFSGGGKIVYGVKNGDLGWFSHTGQATGTTEWANSGQFKKVGSGWVNIRSVF